MDNDKRVASNEFVIYKKRYVLLCLLFVSLVITFFQINEYAAIGNVVIVYYDVDYTLANWTALLSNIGFCLFSFPIGIFIAKYGYRKSMLTVTFLTATASILKCFTVSQSAFWILFTSQCLVAFTAPFLTAATPVFANSWFKTSDVAYIIAVRNCGITVGQILSFVPPVILEEEIGSISTGLGGITIAVAIISVLVFISTLFFVDNKPISPPSLAQHKRLQVEPNESLFVLFTNVNAVIALIATAGTVSINIAVMVTLNQSILSSFNDSFLVSLSGILLNISGIPGALFAGFVVKKYPKYKLLSVLFTILHAFSVSIYILSLWTVNTPLLLLASFGNGFLYNASNVTLMDFVLECTYPFPESMLFVIAAIISMAPPFPITLIITYLTTSYDAQRANVTLIPVAIVTIFLNLLIKEDLRRTKANEERTPIIQINK